MAGKRNSEVRWKITGSTGSVTNKWSSSAERGYTAVINFVPATIAAPYSLVVTGSGAPATAGYKTLKLAKHAFSLFLHTK